MSHAGNSSESKMSALWNQKLEVVAQELAAGKTPLEASEAAGYPSAASSFASNARKRAQRADVRKRVREIRAPAIKRAEDGAGVTSEWMLTKLYKVANPDLGRKKTKVSDQIAAMRLAAQIKGLLVPDVALTVNNTVATQINNNGNGPRERIAGLIDKVAGRETSESAGT